MSETLNFKTPETFEAQTNRIEKEHRIEAHSEVEPKATEINQETARHNAVESATTETEQILEKFNAAAEEAPATTTPIAPSREARKAMANRTIKNLRQQESLPERSLSRVIHQPIVRAVSEGAGKTVTRPSGMLGGGLAAFVGSGSYLILAKTLHFTYSYSVSLALFVGGFLLGLILELLVHMATASHRQPD